MVTTNLYKNNSPDEGIIEDKTNPEKNIFMNLEMSTYSRL